MSSPIATQATPDPADSRSTAPASRITTSQPAYDLGLLGLRLALGLTMALHGSQKLLGWFDGPGLEGTAAFFTASGYPSGKIMALVAALSETLGGLGLALGLLTPLAGAAIVGVMINALAVKWSGAFFAPKGVEYEVLITAAAAALTLTGPGRIAVDRLLPGLRSHRLVFGIAVLLLGVVAGAGVLMLRK